MFAWNAAFVITLLFVAMARVRRREWFSSSVVVFALGLMAIGVQRILLSLIHGDSNGLALTATAVPLFWFFALCSWSAKKTWEDFRTALARRRARTDASAAS
jgi:hypothetical protein